MILRGVISIDIWAKWQKYFYSVWTQSCSYQNVYKNNRTVTKGKIIYLIGSPSPRSFAKLLQVLSFLSVITVRWFFLFAFFNPVLFLKQNWLFLFFSPSVISCSNQPILYFGFFSFPDKRKQFNLVAATGTILILSSMQQKLLNQC